jgi:hypothetical protein
MSRGKSNMCGLRRVDSDFPHCEPGVEEGKVVLEAQGGDGWITMHCQESRVVRKSRDGGIVCRGQIGGET